MSVPIIALIALLCLSCSNTSEEATEQATAQKVNKNPKNEKVSDFNNKDAAQNRKIGKQLVLEDIVGTWVLEDAKIGGTRTIRYNKDNTFRAVVNISGEEYIDEGVWRVSGDQIKFKRKGNNIEVAIPVEINNNQLVEKYYNSGKEQRNVYEKNE